MQKQHGISRAFALDALNNITLDFPFFCSSMANSIVNFLIKNKLPL